MKNFIKKNIKFIAIFVLGLIISGVGVYAVTANADEISYDNTVSISQFKNATETKMISELKRYISNLNTSGDLTINTIAAINYLKHERKTYEEMMKKDLTIIYNKTLGSIKLLEKELDKDEYKNIMGEISDRK